MPTLDYHNCKRLITAAPTPATDNTHQRGPSQQSQASIWKYNARLYGRGLSKIAHSEGRAIKRVTCSEATPYPPAGQAREWWQRLKNAFGTASSAFVGASLEQLIAAAHLARWGQMLFHQAIPKKRSCVSAFRMTHGYRTRQPAIF
jgi:hypothetical protein